MAITLAAYLLSWLLPISGLSGYKGYEGAKFGHELLTDGSAYLYKSVTENNYTPVKKFMEKTLGIFYGIPNILFAISMPLIYFNRSYAIYFAAPCLLIMLLWAVPTLPPGAVHLWAITGMVIFYLSLKTYMQNKKYTYSQVLMSMPLICTYVLGILITTVNILF